MMSTTGARLRRRCAGAAVLLLALVATGCTEQPSRTPSGSTTAEPSPTVSAPPPSAVEADRQVVVVSVDGLRSSALTELGEAGAPTLSWLVEHGATTLDARTLVESTSTLPNHAGMLTSRRVRAEDGGHGVSINVDPGPPTTVERLAGAPVPSVFDVLDAVDRSSALFASKDKFELFGRSWPALDRFEYDGDDEDVVDAALTDLREPGRGLTFVHLGAPDDAGHDDGWTSASYDEAVAESDALIGRLVDEIEADDRLRADVVLIVTADHGGDGTTHRDASLPTSFTIPFLVWGAGVPEGADLYDLNPDRRVPDPDQQPGYVRSFQPIRNADVGNLVASLLGAPPIPGSGIGVEPLQVLDGG